MKLRELPFLPISFFLKSFAPASKLIFWIQNFFLLMCLGLLVHAYTYPEFWPLDIQAIANTSTDQVKIKDIEHGYRRIPLELPVYQQEIIFSAGPLQVHPVPVLLFFLFQILAWAVLLSFSSGIRSRWAYLFFVLFALFLHFSNVVQILIPQDQFRIAEFLIAGIFLGLAYAQHTNMLKWKLELKFLVNLSLLIGLFGTALYQHGWIVFHSMSSSIFPYEIFVLVAFLFFIGKEPTNLLFLITNNRRQVGSRLGPWFILGIYFLVLIVELFPALNLLGFSEMNRDFGIRPLHLIAIGALLTSFSSQNQFNPVKHIFTSRSIFTFVLLSWALIASSFLFLLFSQGDFAFIYAIERISIVFFLGMGIMHIFYVYTNHFELLKEKFHFYYLMLQGRTFSFMIVGIFGLVALIFTEGKDNWRSFRLFFHSFAVMHADHEFINGEKEQAINNYRFARELSPNSAKANYNLAFLSFDDPQKANIALEAYSRAVAWQEFPYARLNAGNLLSVNNEKEQAKNFMLAGVKEQGSNPANPYLLNNLAKVYEDLGQPDSAIFYYKQALLADLSQSNIYSNLAMLYWKHDKKDEVESFMQLAAEANLQEEAWTNILWYQLATSKELNPIPSQDSAASYPMRYNYLVGLLRDNQLEAAAALAKSLGKTEGSFDAQMLDAYLMFSQDSIEHALSKANYFFESKLPIAAQADFLMGIAFWKKGIPEMAAKYFTRAGSGPTGKPKGTLYAAKMEIDNGNKEKGAEMLTALRVEHQELWEDCAKELALLLVAYNQRDYAFTEWDLNDLSYNERMRISLYADSMNQYITAEENFRQLIQEDSLDIAPFYEMAQIYNKYRDTLASVNLNYALSINPKSEELKSALTESYLLQGDLSKAQTTLNELDPESGETRFLQANLVLAQKDTVQAIALLDSLYQANPYEVKVLDLFTRLLMETGQSEQAHALLQQAMEVNDSNPTLWLRFAKLFQDWAMPEDAGYAASQAVELFQQSEEKDQIRKEFEQELSAYQEQFQ